MAKAHPKQSTKATHQPNPKKVHPKQPKPPISPTPRKPSKPKPNHESSQSRTTKITKRNLTNDANWRRMPFIVEKNAFSVIWRIAVKHWNNESFSCGKSHGSTQRCIVCSLRAWRCNLHAWRKIFLHACRLHRNARKEETMHLCVDSWDLHS